jgi:hypothetical protein
MSTIFPLDPEINDVYQGYLYNGTAWEIIGINLNDVPTGPTGPAGPTGADGPVGADGPMGPAGENGMDGAPGQDGAPGLNGMDGAPGQDGQDGAPGQDGQDGAPGQDGQDGAPGQDGQDGANGLGYKVRAEIDDSAAAATGISSWIFEEYSAYQNGNRVRISAEDGSFQEGTISDISGLSFQLNIESSSGTLGSGYYPVTIVGSPGLNGEPGIGYSSEGKVPSNLVIGNVNTDGNSSQTFIFPAKLAYQIGNRVRISQVSNLSNYVEGSIETIDVITSATGVAPNITYSYATTVGIRFDAKGGSGTWTANSTLLSIGLSIPKVTPNLTIGEATIKTTSTALTSSSATTIVTIPKGLGLVSAELLVLLSSNDDGSYYTSKMLVCNGSGVEDIKTTEYAIIEDGSMDITFTTVESGSNILLKAATTNIGVVAKVVSTSISAENGAG